MMASMKKSRKNTMILVLAAAIIIAVILAVTQMNRTLKLNGLPGDGDKHRLRV